MQATQSTQVAQSAQGDNVQSARIGMPTPFASPKPAIVPAPPGAPAPPIARPTVAPAVPPTGTNPLYDPPAGTYPNFPQSQFLQRLPLTPTVNANTAAWLAKLGTLGFGNLQFAANAAGAMQDYGFPIYRTAYGANAMPVKIHCTEPWGKCKVEGTTVYLDARERPQDGGNPGHDSHLAIVDTQTGLEYDFWGTQWPPKNGILNVAWGGSCPLSGQGYASCSATSSGTALSIGIIRAKDLAAAVQTGGTLPYALQSGVKCSNGFVAPLTSSDGKTAGCPPQGSRLYLAMHDADVNATAASGIVKAIMRTIDEDHYGMFITDTSGGENGFSLIAENDVSYTAEGLPAPFVNQIVPLAQSEGMSGTTPSNNLYYIPLTTTGIDLPSMLKFL